MRVGVLTSSRADYGIYLPLLKKMAADPFFECSLIVFGTHLSQHHGHTVDLILNDGFLIEEKIHTVPAGDSPMEISQAMGKTMNLFSEFWDKKKKHFDLVISLGDRYEMFAAVSAAVPFNISIAHFHGGETSLGAIDESFRHSITAMAQLHFTATQKSAERVAAIKGNKANIYNVGAMSLDHLSDMQLMSAGEFEKKFGVYPDRPVLVTFHPETIAYEKNELYCEELLKALEQLGKQIIITLPNADTMGNLLRKKMIEFDHQHKNVFSFDTLGSHGYFSCMNLCSVMIGNTSSGIIEAASFQKPVVNLGMRQAGRERGENVIDCEIKAERILEAVNCAQQMDLKKIKNIYGDGNASSKVIQILKSLKV